MKRLVFICSVLLIVQSGAFSQEKQKFLIVNGYLTSMQSVMFDSLSGPFINENLIHNRINLKGFISDHITFAAEFRNRLFTGDRVRTGTTYSESIAKDQGLVSLSWNLINEHSFFLNTAVDRFWIDFNYGKFQLRAGRQRINWGQTLVWNPNDIFNAYSFFDFDYVERPGSDAVRLQYFPGSSSTIEIAVKANYKQDVTAAALYRFNKWGYDIQFLGGFSESRDFVAGAGWSGAIGSVSFRGEASWFQPIKNSSGRDARGIFTTGFDKVFEKNSSAQLQFMYCINPMDLTSFTSLYTGDLTSRDLAFSKYSVFGQYTYPFTPLFNGTISAMWFPDIKGYFAGPSLDFSLAENVDLSLFWQHFEIVQSGIRTRINLGFLRFKYSF
jgi:hypothetical protein